jgi:hypothetical protein
MSGIVRRMYEGVEQHEERVARFSKRIGALLQSPASSADGLIEEPRPTLLAQVYEAVYKQGFLGGAGN